MKRVNNYTKTTNLYKIIFLFVVFLGIGYAFLEAGLNINGDTTVVQPEFNTYVQSVSVTAGSTSGTPTIVGNDKKEIDFSTALTNDVNSFFEETTTLTNHGSQKSYLRNIDVKVYDSSNNEVTLAAPYEYTLTHGDGTPVDNADEIAAGSTITYKLKFNYISGTDMNTVTDYPTYTFKITYNFTKDVIILPTGKTKDNLQLGDEIWIRGEYFNFVKYDGTNDEDIVLLSKWNLKVGNIVDASFTKIGEYTISDFGYNKQSSEVRGWVDGAVTYNGTSAFSGTNYWYDNGLKPVYGTSYPTDIYDAINYKGAPGEQNYSIAYYIDNYKTILTGYGATIKDARLLTYSEATNIGTNSFMSNTTFWLGSAYDDNCIWRFRSYGDFRSDGGYTSNDSVGVRPVIVISKSNI